MERRTHELLDAAYEAGVRYVDAARSYGLAERFLGTWLTERKRPQAIRWSDRSGATHMSAMVDGRQVHEVKDTRSARCDAVRREPAELGDTGAVSIHSATWETGVLDDLAVPTSSRASKRRVSRSGSQSAARANLT